MTLPLFARCNARNVVQRSERFRILEAPYGFTYLCCLSRARPESPSKLRGAFAYRRDRSVIYIERRARHVAAFGQTVVYISVASAEFK